MAIDFPTPTYVGQTYTYGARTWGWTGYAWQAVTSASATRDQVFYFDGIEKDFNDTENRFQLRYQGELVQITNPFSLLVVLNGATQAIYYPEYVYTSVFTPNACFIDSDGYLVFPEPVPAGSMCTIFLMAGPSVPTVSTYYPFNAMDILVGAGA